RSALLHVSARRVRHQCTKHTPHTQVDVSSDRCGRPIHGGRHEQYAEFYEPGFDTSGFCESRARSAQGPEPPGDKQPARARLYLLVIVSGFIFVVVALQLILSRVGRPRKVSVGDDSQPSLRDWATWDFETWQDRQSGAQAALHILLPIAAAALGMTAFGI